jgi:hypothetical protein
LTIQTTAIERLRFNNCIRLINVGKRNVIQANASGFGKIKRNPSKYFTDDLHHRISANRPRRLADSLRFLRIAERERRRIVPRRPRMATSGAVAKVGKKSTIPVSDQRCNSSTSGGGRRFPWHRAGKNHHSERGIVPSYRTQQPKLREENALDAVRA